MIIAILAAVQSAAPPPATATPPPDIAFAATVRARSLTIEKRGEARITVSADPPGGNVVDIRAPRANGRKTIRDPSVTVRIETRIAPPGAGVAGSEDDTGNPR